MEAAMPRFDFQCDSCGKILEEIMSCATEREVVCTVCEEKMHWKPSAAAFRFTFPIEPMYDSCLGETVHSKKQYENLKREKGLVKID
jgi:putative FmdB family regulatory protein